MSTRQVAETGIVIRDAQDADADGVIALIEPIFAEYDCVFDVDDEMPDLRTPASVFTDAGGRFFVAECDGKIVGSIGYQPIDITTAELHRLYVDRSHRQYGLGKELCALVEEQAIAQGADTLVLWTDTRFTKAHSLYEKRGYVRQSETRELHDLSNTVEYQFIKKF